MTLLEIFYKEMKVVGTFRTSYLPLLKQGNRLVLAVLTVSAPLTEAQKTCLPLFRSEYMIPPQAKAKILS